MTKWCAFWSLKQREWSLAETNLFLMRKRAFPHEEEGPRKPFPPLNLCYLNQEWNSRDHSKLCSHHACAIRSDLELWCKCSYVCDGVTFNLLIDGILHFISKIWSGLSVASLQSNRCWRQKTNCCRRKCVNEQGNNSYGPFPPRPTNKKRHLQENICETLVFRNMWGRWGGGGLSSLLWSRRFELGDDCYVR